MAHKKGASSSKNGRDSQSQRLGVKRFDGQEILAGTIIIRQHGNKIWPGINVGMGRDFTLYAKVTGKVKFEPAKMDRKRVSVYPVAVAAAS